MTPQAQRAYDSFEYGIRVEAFIDFAIEASMSHVSLCLPDTLSDDFLDSVTHATATPHPSVVPLLDYLLQEGDSEDEILCALNEMASQRPDLMGICLQVATPVRKKNGDGMVWSWGHYTTEWVFAPTYDEAWALAVEWAKEREASPE